MNDVELAKIIAKKVKENNGDCYYVGGYVRDRLLNIESKDIDIEIYGISQKKLENILSEIGTIIIKGKSFGVYGIKGSDIDIALPRTETKIGDKHCDFDISVDPYIKKEKACLRRDFTINALMMDVLTNEIYDYVDGLKDLNDGVIKHVDDKTFPEDPLRVLRACQFAARFNFIIDENTKELCKKIDLSQISLERVETETKKALLKANKPSIYFELLKELKQLSLFYKPLEDMIDVKQNPKYHPEGDVWNHTMLVVDSAVKYRDKVEDSYKFMNFALYHDIGKPSTTKIGEKGYIQSINHEFIGAKMVKQIIYLKDKNMISYLKDCILYHMEINKLYSSTKNDNKYCKLFNKVKCPKDLIYFSLVDKKGQGNRFSEKDLDKELKYLNEKYNLFQERLNIPLLTGKDLIENGLVPNEEFKELLKKAEDLRMCNISKESALKMILNERKKL